jgi:hypothetical protein
MKKDPAALHREHMRELHTLFTKKTQYHHQKAYLELKDVYWLVHEFFSAFLGKTHHFTEQELMQELKNFKHDYMTLDEQLIHEWHSFFEALSQKQYAGGEISQDDLKALLVEFNHLVDETVGKERAPPDAFSSQIQSAQIYVKNNDVDHAYEVYKKLMVAYEHLSDEKRKLHYEQLERLYQAIVAARNE